MTTTSTPTPATVVPGSQIEQARTAAAAVPAKPTAKQVLTNVLEKNRAAIGASLPSGMSQDRFMRLLLTATNTNPDLLGCDPVSFLAAGVTAAQLGLEPNDPRGLAYLIPFNDRKRGRVVNFIIGYKGMLELARRSGLVTAINAFPVFEGDEFEYALGLDPTLRHVPGDHDEDPAKLTHVYAVAKIGGDPQFVVLTRRQIDKTKASSQGAKSEYSPWNTNYVEMALKTALRRLCKWLPQSVEMAKADAVDGASLRIGADMLIQTDHGEAIDADGVIDRPVPVDAIEAGAS